MSVVEKHTDVFVMVPFVPPRHEVLRTLRKGTDIIKINKISRKTHPRDPTGDKYTGFPGLAMKGRKGWPVGTVLLLLLLSGPCVSLGDIP